MKAIFTLYYSHLHLYKKANKLIRHATHFNVIAGTYMLFSKAMLLSAP